jgi:anti-anti-sigma regulatory factor
MAENRFDIALLSAQDGEASASFAGAMTDEAAAIFTSIIDNAVATEPERLVIDLRHARSADPSAALSALTSAVHHARSNGIEVVVRR